MAAPVDYQVCIRAQGLGLYTHVVKRSDGSFRFTFCVPGDSPEELLPIATFDGHRTAMAYLDGFRDAWKHYRDRIREEVEQPADVGGSES